MQPPSAARGAVSPSQRSAAAQERPCRRLGGALLFTVWLLASEANAELNVTTLTKYPRYTGAGSLPDQPRANSSNPYIPDGCLTYDERYSRYRDEVFFANRTAAWAPNTLKPHATKAIIMRIHAHTHFKPDLILAFRSLMSEAQENGYHTFFLTTAFSWDKREKITRAELMSNIPPEFRQNVVFYDTADVRAHYPAHGISEYYSGYLPATWFMHKYQAYEFLYILESDVRLIGHWGQFLDASLAFSAHVPERFTFDHDKTDSLTGDTPMMTEAERAGFKHMQISLGNDNTQGRPADFIVFNGVTREWEHDVEEHGNTGHNQVFLNIGEIYHAWIMVQGWSRKLMNQLHQWSRTGQGAYDEIAPTTIAVHEGDKVVSVKIPQFEGPEGATFDRCCTKAGELFYKEMYTDRSVCKPFALLHMVKLADEVWDKPTIWQDSASPSGHASN